MRENITLYCKTCDKKLITNKKLGKPKKCEKCGKSGLIGREIHWASKDHKYERNLNDWLRLCAKCHKRFDGYGGDYNYVR